MARNRSMLPFPADASWIGSSHPFDLHEAYLNFRSPAQWQLMQQPTDAVLYLSADSRYKLWINEQFVSRGPARSYPDAQAVDCVPVNQYLQAGVNLIAIQVYQPGYSHFSYVHRGSAGVLAFLICDGEAVLITNEQWRVQRDDSFAANVPRVSIYGSGVEVRDLRQAEDWISSQYDDSPWEVPRIVSPVDGAIWRGLNQRELPFLTERTIPMTLLETRHGMYPAIHQSDPHLALREGWLSATSQTIQAQDQIEFSPILADGEAAYWLFDLGRDYTCQGWAEIEGALGNEQLSISYQEKIREGQLLISDPQTYCRVRLTDRFILQGGTQTAETFALRGGRYLLWQLVGPTGPDLRLRFYTRVAEYPLQIDRPLSINDDALNRIISMCETTFRACLQDGFVDCVWRESSQWLGDALPQSLIMATLSNDVRPLRQVLTMAAQGAYADGVLPSVLPGEVHAYAVVDYNFTWVELLHIYWDLTQDNDFMTMVWPTLLKILDRFYEDLNDAGLLMSQPGRRLFLDWSPLSRQEPNAVYNLRYLLALQQAAQLADKRELITDEARMWRERATQLQSVIQAQFWRNGYWYDDLAQTTFSQQTAALALLTETTPPSAINDQLDALTARSLDLGDDPAPDKMVLASPFMHHYVFEALRYHQRYSGVVEIIRRRWGRWVSMGYPTTWENWNVDFPDGSQCHAFSAHPLYHLAEIEKVVEL